MTIDQFKPDLRQLFCRECRQRRASAKLALQELSSAARPANCYERLHQEFDSLYGAARAINNASLEKLFLLLRRYARFLSRRASRHEVDEGQRRIMERAVDIVQYCSGRLDDCEWDHCEGMAQTLILQAESEMEGAPPVVWEAASTMVKAGSERE